MSCCHDETYVKRKNKLLMQGYAYFCVDQRCSGYMYQSAPGQARRRKLQSTEQYQYTQARFKQAWKPRLVYCSSQECPTLLKKGKVAQASPGRVRCVACGAAPNACLCPVEAVRHAVQQGRTRKDVHTYGIACPTCPQHKAYVFSRKSRDEFRKQGEFVPSSRY